MAADAAPSFVFLPGLAEGGEAIEIAGDEARYLARVVRVRPGERVVATDGEGLTATLEILECADRVRARVLERTIVPRAATLEIWCGAPEGDRADWLVEKLAELGVARLRLVDGARGKWERFAAREERLHRLTIAALRQSRSAHRLVILPPLPLSVALAALAEGGVRWVCRPDGAPAAGVVQASPGPAIAAVGPSSGFSPEELNVLRENGFVGVALARPRLRTETAALAVAAVWAAADAASAPHRHGPGPAAP